jgi:hypothetical protein
MEQANRRLELLASHLTGAEGDSLLVNPTAAAAPATESATVALPEKLCDDPHWRVHRCRCSMPGTPYQPTSLYLALSGMKEYSFGYCCPAFYALTSRCAGRRSAPKPWSHLSSLQASPLARCMTTSSLQQLAALMCATCIVM